MRTAIAIAALLLSSDALAAAPKLTPRNAQGQCLTRRSTTQKRHFMKLHPCPAGPDKGSKVRCLGYVVDHICPLACCGKDEPVNMQWQTLRQAQLKDRTERRCETCNRNTVRPR